MKKLLIVEDEPALLSLLSDKFRKEGFEVLNAKDGVEGLASALENKPDIILLDVFMPNMDGVTMLKKLREDEWGKTAMVMMLTNADESSYISDAMNLKVDHFLVKSDWHLDNLVEEVKQHLEITERLKGSK